MESVIDEHKEPDLTIRAKPNKGVFANAAHQPKAMHLIPCCLSLKEIQATDNPSIFMKFGKTIFAMGNHGKKESAAYHIRWSDQKDEVNCSIKKLKSDDGDYPSIIECTVIYNTKKIAAGDELVLYREKKEKVDKHKTVVVCLDNTESASKKLRS